ncbi:MAG: extracellular solute-binding protein [Propionibacteriaceae bacterium]|jgi:raffinose/stachyose/melibiose transport system substrate-binding protein|nr:extracellular solute-binding protein [Propionibacteriaceae bacterium]
MLRIRHATTATVLGLSLTCAVALAGCSSGGSGDSGTAGATGQAADTAGAATTAAADYTGRTLTIWHYESENSAMGLAWAKAEEIFKAEHPGVTVTVVPQTFEQIQKNAKIILTGDDVPDVMEYNKGNATAGQLASQGLLTPLDDEVTARGWDKIVSGALAATGQYDDRGLMGSGSWYGITNYGEYVTVYYNADLFEANGIAVPTTFDEFTAAMDAFVAKGITPLAAAGAEYPMMQIWYELALSKADRTLVNEFELFDGDLDWHNAAFTYATDTLREWVDKGYIASDSAGLVAEDMGTGFISGQYPIMISGSWWFARVKDEAQFN